MEKLAIYGAGRGGRLIFNELKKRGIKVEFFIDKYIDIDKLNGIPVLKPKDVKEFKEPITVLVSIPQSIPEKFFNISKNLIKEYHLENFFFSLAELKSFPSNVRVLSLTETFKKFPFLKENPIFSTRFYDGKSHLEYSDKIVEFLADEKSKKLYEEIVKFRKLLNPEYLPFPDDEIQYFPKEIFGQNFEKLNNVETFIDLGAFVGDTAIFATEILRNLKNYFAFELDINNFKRLKVIFNLIKERKKEVNFLALPLGGFSGLKCVKFSSAGPSSTINPKEGEILGLVADLDSIFINFKVDFIKMDIEGAELDALKGMDRIIKECKPILAISIYHSNRDLVEIPKYLAERYGDFYNFYIRTHGELTLETILYAVPKEK